MQSREVDPGDGLVELLALDGGELKFKSGGLAGAVSALVDIMSA